jgi:hypothetical protein
MRLDPSAEGVPASFDGISLPLANAFSRQTLDIVKQAAALKSPQSPGAMSSQLRAASLVLDQSLEAKLYAALADAKVLTAQIAMHLDRSWRDKLFRQLDSLHDIDEWDLDTEPLHKASFSTFLRTLHAVGAKRRPGLGLSFSGNLIGAWTVGVNRLTIEFLPNDQLRWAVLREYGQQPERASGKTTVGRIGAVLAPYDPKIWFDDAGQRHPG